MKVKPIQVVVVLAAVSLAGLLIIQVHWFHKAWQLEEKQFAEKVNLALRGVADQLLSGNGDHTSRIPPVTRTASNEFIVRLEAPVQYSRLHDILKDQFANYRIDQDYQIALWEADSPFLVLGGLVKANDPDEVWLPCLTRKSIPASYNFSITFPSRDLYLAEGMQVWYGTALTFLLVLGFFSYTAVVTLKEKKLSAMKRDFINNMTHELKTPIANISIASEVLRKPHPKFDVNRSSRYAHLIYQETQRLQLQVDHVLQIAQLERKDLQLKMDTVDVHQLIGDVMNIVDVRIQKRQGFLKSDLKAERPFVRADKHHLKNVLYNLLDNAEKYSPDSPQITILTRNWANELVISVMDMGLGISRKAQKKIFDTFYRTQRGDVYEIKGFGLGLSYVKSIVEAHKGSVRVNSKMNQGSLFELFFPCA